MRMIFSTFAQQCSKIESIHSRLAITELVAQLLQKSSSEDIGKICYLLQGRVVPLYEPKEFGIADKFMIRAIAQATNRDIDEVVHCFRQEGDLGAAAQKLAHSSTQKVSVEEVFHILYSLTELNGQGSQERKVETLANLLQKLDPLSVRYIVRIPLGKLRLGFSDMTILDALSWMITGDKTHRELLEHAYNVYPDISFIATTVKEKGIKGLDHVDAKVGVPILSCLCQRIPTAQEMIDKMGTVFIEPKYDGVRVQIHIQQKTSIPRVLTFSRNLEQTTEMFPEVQQIVDYLSTDTAILDAEAVGVDPKSGDILPFQETTTRKRKHGIEQAALDVPIRFYIFDILVCNNKDILSEPLEKRRELLEKLLKKNATFQLAPHVISNDPKQILSYHEEQRKKGLEGVVVKKWNAPYEPGRKGYTWVKLKEQEGNLGKLSDTVDTVVMGYYRGEGKRSTFGIGAFLVGIRQGERIVTVSKIGTGVSDQQWKDLKVLFDNHASQIIPKEYGDVDKLLIPDVWLEPHIVVEIAGDDITKSPNHSAGYAIRFPRLIRIRDDKSVREITTHQEFLTLYQQQ
jgi:DNA ligase-1